MSENKSLSEHLRETREAAGVEASIPRTVESTGVDVSRVVQDLCVTALQQQADQGELPEQQRASRLDLVWQSGCVVTEPEPGHYKATTISKSPLGDVVVGYGLSPKQAIKRIFQRYREDLIKAKLVSGPPHASMVAGDCQFWESITV